MDAEEIKSIMRQFKHGVADSEWKQFLKSIKITKAIPHRKVGAILPEVI